MCFQTYLRLKLSLCCNLSVRGRKQKAASYICGSLMVQKTPICVQIHTECTQEHSKRDSLALCLHRICLFISEPLLTEIPLVNTLKNECSDVLFLLASFLVTPPCSWIVVNVFKMRYNGKTRKQQCFTQHTVVFGTECAPAYLETTSCLPPVTFYLLTVSLSFNLLQLIS